MNYPMQRVLNEVQDERQRQISREGWSHEHDDEHVDGSLAAVAAVYALNSSFRTPCHSLGEQTESRFSILKWMWPQSWASYWFKPDTRRRDLVKAAALLIAEIERLDRSEGKKMVKP